MCPNLGHNLLLRFFCVSHVYFVDVFINFLMRIKECFGFNGKLDIEQKLILFKLNIIH